MIKQKYGVVYTPDTLSEFVAILLKRVIGNTRVSAVLDPASGECSLLNAAKNVFGNITNPIIIKNNVWIAANAMILDGSILNEFSVIGANSCFKGVAEKGGIYYGNPAILRKKRMLDKEYKIDFEPHFR